MNVCGTCDLNDYKVTAITDRGIAMGDHRDRVHEIYGEPGESSSNTDFYREQGLRFGYTDDGIIHHIYVIWPGCDNEMEYWAWFKNSRLKVTPRCSAAL